MPADLRRHIHVPWGRWATAVALGIGVFQLFDGVVNHKILRIHQNRSGVDLSTYDLVWIGSAVVLDIIGLALGACPPPRR